jgi:hypothetical protein
MLDVMVQYPICTEHFEGLSYGDCGVSFELSAFSFLSFKIIAEYVLVNLFIGMILEEFIKADDNYQEFYIINSPISLSKSTKIQSRESKHMYASTQQGEGSRSRRSTYTHGYGTKSMEGSYETNTLSSSRRASVATGNMKSRCVAPVHDLSCLECWEKYTGGGKEDFILISDVPIMMRGLPQPLGLSRNMYGEPVMTSRDRSVCKLICAELNLISVSRPEEVQGFWPSVRDKIRHWLGVHVPKPPTTTSGFV